MLIIINREKPLFLTFPTFVPPFIYRGKRSFSTRCLFIRQRQRSRFGGIGENRRQIRRISSFFPFFSYRGVGGRFSFSLLVFYGQARIFNRSKRIEAWLF
jgi:hypothetical protein